MSSYDQRFAAQNHIESTSVGHDDYGHAQSAFTTLMKACRADRPDLVLSLVKESGSDIEQFLPEPDGRRASHIAAQYDCSKALKALIELGVDLDAPAGPS